MDTRKNTYILKTNTHTCTHKDKNTDETMDKYWLPPLEADVLMWRKPWTTSSVHKTL